MTLVVVAVVTIVLIVALVGFAPFILSSRISRDEEVSRAAQRSFDA